MTCASLNHMQGTVDLLTRHQLWQLVVFWWQQSETEQGREEELRLRGGDRGKDGEDDRAWDWAGADVSRASGSDPRQNETQGMENIPLG